MIARSRLIPGLCGLALVVPALPAVAAPDDVPQPAGTAPVPQPSAGAPPSIGLEPDGSRKWSTYEPTSGPQPSSGLQPPAGPQPSPGSPPESAPAPGAQKDVPTPHRHKGLFGWRHCVECQRARVKQHDGVEIPPPPSQAVLAGMAVQGEAVVTGPVVVSDSHAEVVQDAPAAGFAVVGPGVDPSAPGVAVVGGAAVSSEPEPVGVARGAQNPWPDPRMAAMPRRPGAGPYDASVVPTGMPPAQDAMAGPGHDRPHVISHLFGLPKLGWHRRLAEEQERRQHAAIAYGDSSQKVVDVPASVVYPSDGGR